MNKHDLIRFMGRFPDKIYSAEEAERQHIMYSKKWVCSQCGQIYQSEEKIKIPAPCKICGGIGFTRKEEEEDGE